MRQILTPGLVVFALALLVFGLSVNGIWATDHATSFTQLDYAVWHSHSVALGDATKLPPWSVDDFTYKGQNYSALAPGTAFLALPFVGPAYDFAGYYTAYGPVLLASELFVSLMGAISAYLVYKVASSYFRRSTSLFLGFAFAFSTICWPFATYFFQSDVSVAFVLLAAYFGLRAARSEGPGTAPSLICGIAAGVAFTVDYINAILLPIFVLFLLASKWKSKTSAALAIGTFVLGVLPSLAGIGAYNYAIFGNPLSTTEQNFLGKSSVFGAFTTPILNGITLDLFSVSRGLFFFTPLLALGVVGYIYAFKGKAHRLEMLFFIALFLGILLPYSAWYDPTGGDAFGPRFLLAAIPFLLLPAGYVVDRVGSRTMWGVYALFLVGALVNGVAAIVSAIPPDMGADVSPFFNFILPRLTSGNLDTWWVGNVGAYWPLVSALVISLGTVVPVALVIFVRRREGKAQSGAEPVENLSINAERPS